jgi:hypothetical protein
MLIDELAEKLSRMYEKAPKNEKAAMIHLFGIRYSTEIENNGYTPKEIIDATKLEDGSKMPESYKTEISKGVHLAKYVTEKKHFTAMKLKTKGFKFDRDDANE